MSIENSHPNMYLCRGSPHRIIVEVCLFKRGLCRAGAHCALLIDAGAFGEAVPASVLLCVVRWWKSLQGLRGLVSLEFVRTAVGTVFFSPMLGGPKAATTRRMRLMHFATLTGVLLAAAWMIAQYCLQVRSGPSQASWYLAT